MTIESLEAPAGAPGLQAGDRDTLDLRLGRLPPPAPTVIDPAAPRAQPGAPPAVATPAAPAPSPAQAAPSPGRDDPGDVYVVQAGDTLSTIAQRELGSAARAADLARLNGLDDADALAVGQVLRLR